MYYIRVKGDFSSAHRIVGYNGKCGFVHGHRWEVVVEVSVKKLNGLGMAIDFAYLKDKLQTILEMLDHKYLNDLEPFKKANPTAENLAKYIFDSLKPAVSDNYEMVSVEVFESPTSSVRYTEETPDA